MSNPSESPPPPTQNREPAEPTRRFVEIALELIDEGPADSQRVERDQDHLQRLASSIARIGVMTPILLRLKDGRYETIAGSYRREAARITGLKTIPAEVIECNDLEAWERCTTENDQRKQISVVEQAENIRKAHVDLNQTLDHIAHTYGRSISWCQDRLDILHWDPILLQAVHLGRLSKAAAAPLARIANQAIRHGLLDNAITHGATARATAQWANTAHLVAQRDGDPTIADITEATGPPPPRLVCTCWMCLGEFGIAAVSHIPTCPTCIEAVSAARDRRERAAYAESEATAAAHSSPVTPA